MGRREPQLAAMAAALLVVGCAQRVGRRASEGALTEVSAQVAAIDPTQPSPLAERSARGAVHGALEELSKPEYLEQLAAILRSAGANLLWGAAQGPGPAAGVPRGAASAGRATGVGGSGAGSAGASAAASPMSQLSEQAARSFAQAFSLELERQIGPDGQGPLGKVIAAATEQAAQSAVRGAGEELGGMFPECVGPERKACLRAHLSELGYALSSGATDGVRDSLGMLPMWVAFSAGLATAVILLWAWSLFRARRRPA